jgi:hypothetical protein
MTTLLEDLGLALRQMCRSMGLSSTASMVVSVVVLGVSLNLVALSVVRNVRHSERHQVRTALWTAAHNEAKCAKAVWISSLKKIGARQRRWCIMQQKMVDRKPESTEYDIKVGVTWGGPGNRTCDVALEDGTARRIAFVAC